MGDTYADVEKLVFPYFLTFCTPTEGERFPYLGSEVGFFWSPTGQKSCLSYWLLIKERENAVPEGNAQKALQGLCSWDLQFIASTHTLAWFILFNDCEAYG